MHKEARKELRLRLKWKNAFRQDGVADFRRKKNSFRNGKGADFTIRFYNQDMEVAVPFPKIEEGSTPYR